MGLEVQGKEWDLYQSETGAGYIGSPANKQMDRYHLEGIHDGRDRLQDQTSTTRTTAMRHTLGMVRCLEMRRIGGKRERLLAGSKEPIRQASRPKG